MNFFPRRFSDEYSAPFLSRRENEGSGWPTRSAMVAGLASARSFCSWTAARFLGWPAMYTPPITNIATIPSTIAVVTERGFVFMVLSLLFFLRELAESCPDKQGEETDHDDCPYVFRNTADE